MKSAGEVDRVWLNCGPSKTRREPAGSMETGSRPPANSDFLSKQSRCIAYEYYCTKIMAGEPKTAADEESSRAGAQPSLSESVIRAEKWGLHRRKSVGQQRRRRLLLEKRKKRIFLKEVLAHRHWRIDSLYVGLLN